MPEMKKLLFILSQTVSFHLFLTEETNGQDKQEYQDYISRKYFNF